MRLLQQVVPDDISNKVLLHLLSIAKTQSARCLENNKVRFETGGWQYNIRPQQTNTQHMVMCEIRIVQFDLNHNVNNINRRKIKTGAIINIKRYMKILDQRFKERFKFLYC